jgi:Peptidase family M28
MRRRTEGSATTAAVATMVLLSVLFFLAWRPERPPAALPADAPADEFSAIRALNELKPMAAAPHPLGSVEHDRVRDYLVGRLRALAVDPQVQTTSVVRADAKWYGRAIGATVSNVLARLPGTSSTRPLMLVAHYDSVPSGPGASDDGSGTVTLLETLRALKAGPPLRNDVILLFTDGEEAGLLGAQAFVNEHPWAHEPGVVLNFEARGACGPSTLFETSAGNGWLIGELARAAPYPVASSLFYEAYKHLPNDTDLTVFKRAGLAGLNFAYCGCFPRYHTMGDSVANLDPRSLQHDGSYALALARHFGDLDLRRTPAPDAVYFNVGHRVLHYPASWTLPLLALALLAAVFVVVVGQRRGRLRISDVAVGFWGWLLAAAVSAGACELLWASLHNSRFVSLLPYGMAYNGDLFAWGFVALTVSFTSAAYAILLRRFGIESLTIGALLWWLLAGAFLSVEAPGASYLLVLPLIVSLGELAYAFRRARAPGPMGVLCWALPAVVGILLAGALPSVLVMLLGTLAVPALVVVTALLVGFLAPQLNSLVRPARWWVTIVAALAALILIGAGMASAGYSATRQRADSIFYVLNADNGTAAWMSDDSQTDAWTRQFLGPAISKGSEGELGPGGRTFLKSSAPRVDLTVPEIATRSDAVNDGRRILDLQLQFAPDTQLTWVAVSDARVLAAAVEGKPVTGLVAANPGGNSLTQRDRAPWLLMYAAPPASGLRLRLELEAPGSPVISVFQDAAGLPVIPGVRAQPRPPGLMPTPFWPPLDSSTVVTRSFQHFAVSSGAGRIAAP